MLSQTVESLKRVKESINRNIESREIEQQFIQIIRNIQAIEINSVNVTIITTILALVLLAYNNWGMVSGLWATKKTLADLSLDRIRSFAKESNVIKHKDSYNYLKEHLPTITISLALGWAAKGRNAAKIVINNVLRR